VLAEMSICSELPCRNASCGHYIRQTRCEQVEDLFVPIRIIAEIRVCAALVANERASERRETLFSDRVTSEPRVISSSLSLSLSLFFFNLNQSRERARFAIHELIPLCVSCAVISANCCGAELCGGRAVRNYAHSITVMKLYYTLFSFTSVQRISSRL